MARSPAAGRSNQPTTQSVNERCQLMRTARLLAVASGGVLVLGAPLGALAATTSSTPASPAPPGESEGYVLQVGSQSQPIAAVGHTKAKSDNGSSSSSAGVVELQGKPLSHTFGGSTSQNGK